MGIFKNLKGTAEQLRTKAGTLAHQHHGKAEQAIDKAAAAADTRTGGKYRDKLGTARQKAHGGLDSLAAQQSAGGSRTPGATIPSPDPTPGPSPAPGPSPEPDPMPAPAPAPSPAPGPDPMPGPTPIPDPGPTPSPDPTGPPGRA